jgi:bifunctional oligoribonuclease and PAP phosphatase NrnA
MNHSADGAVAATVERLLTAPALALACHVTPDGDALGSLLAFHQGARNAGLVSVASWPAPFSTAPHYRSLPGLELATDPNDFPSNPELMMTFDCGSIGRLNELATNARHAVANDNLIVVDHHASNERFGTINIVHDHAASTTVVVRDLFAALGWPLTRDIAWCLYTGLVTDTGRFQFAATTPSVFALAKELIEFDLPVARISRELFDEHQFGYLKLAARVLDRAELDADLALVSSFVTQADLEEFGVGYDEVEGMIDWLRTSVEAEITCICKEAPDGVRVSLRSKERADVAALAKAFGGGGHRLASGFVSTHTIPDVISSMKVVIASGVANG